MQLVGTFQWTERTVADNEAYMTCMECILEYCNLDLEDPNAQNNSVKKGIKSTKLTTQLHGTNVLL
jgi:hypothetical protein